MENPSRGFKGVWIPREIWLSRQLSLLEKVLFVEIDSLDNERGCYASNSDFAKFFGIHPRRIAAHVSSLRMKGCITVTVTNFNQRVIHVQTTVKNTAQHKTSRTASIGPTTKIEAGAIQPHARDFKGVWIPRAIWLSDQLSLMEKVLLVEIHSLDNEDGCFASNDYFGTFFGVNRRRISDHVSSLKSKGCITVSVTNYNERTIHVTSKYAFASAAEMKALQQDRSALIHRLSAYSKGGMTKTSWGV
jgi:DNA-binding MarR family transcriptional regulator